MIETMTLDEFTKMVHPVDDDLEEALRTLTQGTHAVRVAIADTARAASAKRRAFSLACGVWHVPTPDYHVRRVDGVPDRFELWAAPAPRAPRADVPHPPAAAAPQRPASAFKAGDACPYPGCKGMVKTVQGGGQRCSSCNRRPTVQE